MDSFDELLDEDLLQNISEAGSLLPAAQDDPLSTYQYIDAFQELQSSTVLFSSSSATSALPSLIRHFGEHNFEASISSEAKGPDCLFSQELNKIFVNMGKTVPVLFRTTSRLPGLYVRAVAVFVNCTYLHVPVTRCVTHKASDTEENKDPELVEHVVRCISPKAVYHMATDSGRFSVRVQLGAPQAGTDYIKICYKFTCLSSCLTGRKMGIIFTLEDEKEEVLGRHFMNVRVCSCPRRDKEKEETQSGESKKSKKILKRSLKTLEENGLPKKVLKTEPGEIPLVTMPTKFCHLKEFSKLIMDLIYRDIGKEERCATHQEKQLLKYYKRIIEAPDEELHKLVSSV